MIVLVQGSNRKGNATRPVVEAIVSHLESKGESCRIIDLELISGDILHAEMYQSNKPQPFLDAAEETLSNAGQWIFVFPEYNGSFPGALKLFIDALSVRDYKTLFGGKVAGLIGTASGRSGNLRGLDHFSAVLHHLGTSVMPQSLPISLIDGLLDTERKFADKKALASLTEYVDRFLAYSAAFKALA